jgi:hypothetical protein
MANDEKSYEAGYQRGWDEAGDFIERHPNGMPLAVLQHMPDDADPDPDDPEFDEGWRDRLKNEGWL